VRRTRKHRERILFADPIERRDGTKHERSPDIFRGAARASSDDRDAGPANAAQFTRSSVEKQIRLAAADQK
jgi:hypothetical protein